MTPELEDRGRKSKKHLLICYDNNEREHSFCSEQVTRVLTICHSPIYMMDIENFSKSTKSADIHTFSIINDGT